LKKLLKKSGIMRRRQNFRREEEMKNEDMVKELDAESLMLPQDRQEDEEKRDYLDEARRLVVGQSKLLVQKEHLLALDDYYTSLLIGIMEEISK
jgi:hypothetical protein